MTPLFLLALVTPATAPERPFGERTTAHVRSVNPDRRAPLGDGAYGRFEGDLDLGLGVGPTLDFSDGNLGVGVRGIARWYSTAGLYAFYGETLAEHPALERRFGVGLDLTPLFLVRWPRALERGPAVLDLAVDSLSLGVGASFATPHGRGFGAHKGLEGSLGFGVPLAGTAPGPWLEFRASATLPSSARGEAQTFLLFSWHGALMTPLVPGGGED